MTLATFHQSAIILRMSMANRCSLIEAPNVVRVMKYTRSIQRSLSCILIGSAYLLLSVTSLYPSGANDRKAAALLLGGESLELLFNLLDTDLCTADGIDKVACNVQNIEHLTIIERELAVLGLTDISYPMNEILSSNNNRNRAPLSTYSERIINSLDETTEAAFIVGWYGSIATRTADEQQKSNAIEAICFFAEIAKYDTDSCITDPVKFVSNLKQ